MLIVLVLHLVVVAQVMDTCFVKPYPLDSDFYGGQREPPYRTTMGLVIGEGVFS